MRLDWKLVVRGLLSLAVSAAFIVFSLRHTDIADVLRAVGAADMSLVGGYLAILIVVHFVKTARWGLLLKPVGEISFRRLNAASAVGFMLMVTLPLRLGELARPLLVAQPSQPGERRLARSGCLATVLVERIVDSLAMGVLGVISLRVLAPTGAQARLVQHGATLITVSFALLCLALVWAFIQRDKAVAWFERFVCPLLPASLGGRAVRLLAGFIHGLHAGSPGRVVGFLALTVFYWALHVVGFQMVALAFDLQVTLMMATTILACQVVGIMIPAGPGMVGTSQFFTQLGLALCLPGVLDDPHTAARAAGYANTIWLLQFGQQALTGLPFLALGHVSLAGIFAPWQDEEVKTEVRV